MLKEQLDNVRRSKPLIHNITNYVTARDCANILLAVGASPIMADESKEVEEITSLCQGLTINMGTLSEKSIPSMVLSGKKSNSLGHPVVLDPVGVGASTLRRTTALRLLKEIDFTAIRGNLSEIKSLALGSGMMKGVDADEKDFMNEQSLSRIMAFAGSFARETGSIIAITGAMDFITDGNIGYIVSNGHPMMRKVTGTGCQLSALTTAFLSSHVGRKIDSVLASVCAMGVCGELAYKRLGERDGTATYGNYIMDEMFLLKGDLLETHAKYRKV